jgi:uncharacterized protein YecT (DUF1311 family)
MAKNVLKEIEEYKKRSGKLEHSAIWTEVYPIAERWSKVRDEFTAGGIVVKLVTIMEVCCRSWIARMIDHGDPYRSRAGKLLEASRGKIDFHVTSAIAGGSVSMGTFVAHQLPLSRFDLLVSVFDQLLGGDLWVQLAAHRELDWTYDEDAGDMKFHAGKPIIADPVAARATLGRLFEARNVVAHEIPEERPYDLAEIEKFIGSVFIFLRALDDYIDMLLNGPVPDSTMGLKVVTSNKLNLEEAELSQLVEDICNSVDDECATLVKESQSKWTEYATAQSALAADTVRGGSAHGLVYMESLRDLTRQRIRDLTAIKSDFRQK